MPFFTGCGGKRKSLFFSIVDGLATFRGDPRSELPCLAAILCLFSCVFVFGLVGFAFSMTHFIRKVRGCWVDGALRHCSCWINSRSSDVLLLDALLGYKSSACFDLSLLLMMFQSFLCSAHCVAGSLDNRVLSNKEAAPCDVVKCYLGKRRTWIQYFRKINSHSKRMH